MSVRPLQVEWVPLARLSLNPANPRLNDDAVEHVAASLRRFGWQQPVVAKPDGEVIAGNTRLKAAKHLGMKDVPVVWFEGTELDAVAYGIADNRTAEFSSWEEQSLAAVLQHLREEDSLEGVGFTDDEIDELLAQIQDDPTQALIDPPTPEPPDDPVTQPGDLLELGPHRLLCGDAGNVEHLDRLLEGAAIHVANCDPPYNVRVEPRSSNAIAAGLSSFQKASGRHRGDVPAKLRAKDRPLANDFVSDEEFTKLLDQWFGNLARVLLPGRAFYLWGGYSNIANYPAAMKRADLYFSQAIIWVKEHPVLTRKDYMGNFEICYYGWREGAAHQFFGPKNVSDVWPVKKVNPQSMVHLTEKPVELAARALRYSSRPGEHVLDLFGGSGSTLLAAEQTGRVAYLMELDPAYCDVIVARWEHVSGSHASC